MFIRVDNITARTGSREAFRGTNWLIQQDQNWVVMGPNGSGKTLLANILMRRLPLVEGTILYGFDDPDHPDGRPFFHPGEIALFSAETHRTFLRKFAVYHQARWQSFEGENAPTVTSFLAQFHPGQAADLDGKVFPALTDFELQVDHLTRMFDLEPLLSRKVHLLSNGESRKVFLTRLLLQAPKLLILDDPFTGLDSTTRDHLHSMVNDLLHSNRTMILLLGGRPNELPDAISHILTVEDQQVVWKGRRDQFPDRKISLSIPSFPIPAGSSALQTMADWYSNTMGKIAPKAAPVAAIRNVNVCYGDTQVLSDITWTIRPGERWGLQGRNGAGKTTLLSLLLGDNPQAYRNEIMLFGKQRGSGESIWEIKRKIGWVSPELQSFNDQPASCLEVVCSGFFDSIGLYRRPTPDQIKIAAGWMEALGIETYQQMGFSGLSTGMQRLVLLARALVKAPPLLILDEPCQGLDETHRRRFIDIVDRICALTPVTLIYVTHYPDEFPTTITSRLILEGGKVSKIEKNLDCQHTAAG